MTLREDFKLYYLTSQDTLDIQHMDIDWDDPLPPTDCSENTVYVDPPQQPLTQIFRSYVQQSILLIQVQSMVLNFMLKHCNLC